jgi:hypothetical protein
MRECAAVPETANCRVLEVERLSFTAEVDMDGMI